MAKKKKTAKRTIKPKPIVQPAAPKPDKTLAIVGLIVNIIILPGLGSIIGGRIKTGIWQLVLALAACILIFVGAVLSLFLIGIPIFFTGCALLMGVWIWGIVTGAQMIQDSA